MLFLFPMVPCGDLLQSLLRELMAKRPDCFSPVG